MRLEPIAPQDLSPAQMPLYLDMKKGIAGHFNAFKSERDDGALIGPWNPWLHEPGIGKAIWDLTLAMTANAVLPDNVRQIAILTVGAHFNAAYEIYAHIAVAEGERMADGQGLVGAPHHLYTDDILQVLHLRHSIELVEVGVEAGFHHRHPGAERIVAAIPHDRGGLPADLHDGPRGVQARLAGLLDLLRAGADSVLHIRDHPVGGGLLLLHHGSGSLLTESGAGEGIRRARGRGR